jgi:DNA-binding transcriptional LysR family regulator
MQPEILLRDDLQQGRLVSLPQACLPPPKPMHVLTFPSRYPVPKIRTFVDFLVDQFRSEALAW